MRKIHTGPNFSGKQIEGAAKKWFYIFSQLFMWNHAEWFPTFTIRQ